MSRIRYSLVILVVLLVQGCTSSGNRYTYGYYTGKRQSTATTATRASSAETTPDIHVVAKGETLYSIAFSYGEDVRTVAEWNNIRPPYTIYPEQRIRVTEPPATRSGLQLESASPTSSTPPSAAVTPIQATPKPASPPPSSEEKISWQWPTNGKIINTYAAKDTGKKGLDIAGKSGQPIYAAANGSVVYSGNGLRGYGQLIIIKHDDTYFSAYAHNRRLLVKDDQKVNKGQHIADMGDTEAERTMLHFEVRRNGKPVDPLVYLPKRR